MKLIQIPDEVLDACRERGHSDEAIQAMSKKELFHEYCQWEGLINYSHIIWRIVGQLRKAK